MILRACIAALAAFLAAASGPALPETFAGHALGAWLEAFDNGDREAFRRFVQTREPSALPRVEALLQFRRMTGGFDVKAIEESTPARVVAVVQERASEQFGRLVLAVSEAEPHDILSVDIRAIPRPAAFAPARLSMPALVAALEAKLAADDSAGRFSGAVLLAKAGEPVFSRAYGYADRERRIPNTVDTRFRVGSMNKMFTAVAIMQLVQAGKVSLNAPFGTYVTGYPNKELAAKVTVAQLLTHTGGTGDIFGPQFDANRSRLRTVDDFIALFGSRGPEFEPGTKSAYSNYGFILLGAVIERVSGQDYYAYVHDRIFVPAGMTSTGSEPESVAVPGRSIGYTASDDGGVQPNTATLPYRGMPAGGGYSTVGDFLRFANALQRHVLLDARHLEMMTTAKPGALGGSYAYGFGERTHDGMRCYGHNGGAPGMSGNLEICPAAGYVVVALANVDPPAADRVTDYAISRLPLPAPGGTAPPNGVR